MSRWCILGLGLRCPYIEVVRARYIKIIWFAIAPKPRQLLLRFHGWKSLCHA